MQRSSFDAVIYATEADLKSVPWIYVRMKTLEQITIIGLRQKM